jgi:hypothetical protein
MSTSGTMDARRNTPSYAVPNFSMEDKRGAVELLKAKVPLKIIREQLQDSKATSLPQLQQEIKFLWTLQMDDIQYLKNLVESMLRRLEAVILNKGNSTKY